MSNSLSEILTQAEFINRKINLFVQVFLKEIMKLLSALPALLSIHPHAGSEVATVFTHSLLVTVFKEGDQ